MSLFVCMKCNVIENSNCNTRNIDTNPEYPNLHLMDMHGFGESEALDMAIAHSGNVFNQVGGSRPRKILMLCSECNTGQWHNEFDKMYATDEELALAHTSEFNMVTPFDHPELTIKKDDDTRVGYRLYTEDELAKRKKGRNALGSLCAISSALGMGLPPSFNRLFNNRDNHSDQTEEQKCKALRKAELKRKLKDLKRRNDPNEIVYIRTLREEYDRL